MGINWRTGAAAAALIVTVAVPAFADETPQGAAQAQPAVLRGTVEYADLEGGYYVVDGWALAGGRGAYSGPVGKQVIVRGQPVEVSTYMTKTFAVTSMAREIDTAALPLPAGVTVQGKPVAFDQHPVTRGGALMVPLRAVAEAAGAKVSWDGATRTVTVEMSDRKVQFYIGQAEAEVNMRGVVYVRRNLLPVAAAPVIESDRTLVSADALGNILGLYEQVDRDQILDLVAPS